MRECKIFVKIDNVCLNRDRNSIFYLINHDKSNADRNLISTKLKIIRGLTRDLIIETFQFDDIRYWNNLQKINLKQNYIFFSHNFIRCKIINILGDIFIQCWIDRRMIHDEKREERNTWKSRKKINKEEKREQIIQQTLEIHSQRETSDARDEGKVGMRIFRFGGGSCRGNNRIHLHPCPSIPSCAAGGNLTLSDRTCLSPIVVSGYLSIFSFLFFIPLSFFFSSFQRFFAERLREIMIDIWISLTSNVSNIQFKFINTQDSSISSSLP